MATTNKNTALSALQGYFQDSWQELKKVSWPTKNRAIRLTFLVLGFCLVTALILGVMDFGFGVGHKALLDLAPQKEIIEPTGLADGELPFDPSALTVTDSEGNVIDVTGEGSPITITTGEEGGDINVEAVNGEIVVNGDVVDSEAIVEEGGEINVEGANGDSAVEAEPVVEAVAEPAPEA